MLKKIINILFSGNYAVNSEHSAHKWYSDYQKLNLYNGNIAFISEDDEDMIEISYDDGMVIDVGKPKSTDYYYITVVSSDDINSWNNPISEVTVTDKKDLLKKIQETILKHRNR